MPHFRVLPLAWSEINKQVDYLEERAGLEVAERFLDRLMSSFEVLGRTPNMGVSCGFRRPATRRLRRWPVKDFEDWLIFTFSGVARLKSSTFCMEPVISKIS